MAKNNVTVGTFKNDCKVIRLDAEYPGYTGDTKYAIITDLTEEELIIRYPEEIKRYIPYVLLSREMGRAIREHHRNDEKFAKRTARYESVFIACTEEDEALINSLSVEDEQTVLEAESDALEAKQRIRNLCREALKRLTPIQRDYLIRHYVCNESVSDIARADQKDVAGVWRRCKSARAKFIKLINEMEVAAA